MEPSPPEAEKTDQNKAWREGLLSVGIKIQNLNHNGGRDIDETTRAFFRERCVKLLDVWEKFPHNNPTPGITVEDAMTVTAEKVMHQMTRSVILMNVLGGKTLDPGSGSGAGNVATNVPHTFIDLWKEHMLYVSMLIVNGGQNLYGLKEGGFSTVNVLTSDDCFAKKSVEGSLGLDIVIRNQNFELSQTLLVGGTMGERTKSMTFPIQTIINLPISHEFSIFMARAWDPEYPQADPYQKFHLSEDDSCTIEICIFKHSQCITMCKMYHKDRKTKPWKKAFGTALRLSPYSFNTLMWYMPMARLRQVMENPTEAQKRYVKTLMEQAMHIRSLFEGQQDSGDLSKPLLNMTLGLGRAVRTRDSDKILHLMFHGSVEPLVLEEDPKATQCLEEIVCLMPRFIYISRVGLEKAEENRVLRQVRDNQPAKMIRPNMQRGRVLGVKTLHYSRLFVIMMMTSPFLTKEVDWLFECLQCAPIDFPGDDNNLLDSYKGWRFNHLSKDPKKFWEDFPKESDDSQVVA